ncbi:MAG: sigma 54-interacting transcriptional regulator [Planctomycetes bacterium]|nr:sigma 54-interacting transcriptional regulator [Planctomycetota bacterium]
MLIQGARGAGKRSLARSLHARSRRAAREFRVFSCRACSPLEVRRLFLGERHGDARGRQVRYQGLLEGIGEGTLYLDEVEQLDFDMQRILARVVAEGFFRPLGSATPVAFRGRLIFSTCSDTGSAFGETIHSELRAVIGSDAVARC